MSDGSANAEANIVAAVLRDGDLGPVLQAHVASKHFHDLEHGDVWDWLVEFFGQYQATPDWPTLQVRFPGYARVKVSMPTEYYVDQLLASHKAIATNELLMEAAETSQRAGDVDGALRLLNDGLLEIANATSKAQEEHVDRTWRAAVAEYDDLVAHKGELLGVPTGFPTFDEITGGYQKEQFVVIAGPQKAGKSTVLLKNAMAAVDAGYKALWFGFEMSFIEQRARYHGALCGFNYNKILNGDMDRVERATYERILQEREALERDLIMVTDPTAATTIPAVMAKCHQHRPDIVFIDGVYLLDAEVEGSEGSDTRSLTKISRSSKRLAQALKIPVVVTHQVLDHKWTVKTGITARSLGYCVDDQTEILTDHGWVTYDRLSEGDTVLTLDHTDGKAEWQQVEEVCVFPAMEREMISMEGAGHSSLTTPNHRWPVEVRKRVRRVGWPEESYIGRAWRTTETLKHGDAIPLAAVNKSLPVEAVYDDAFVELVAWFWTEGSKQQTSSGVTITQSYLVNAENTERIHTVLTKVFGPEQQERTGRSDAPVWRECWRRGSTAEFTINAAGGRQLLAVAPGKVPTHAFLLSLTQQQLDLFIDVSMRADNCGERSLAQKNTDAAEAFQFACILAGHATTRTTRPPTVSTDYPMHGVYLKKRRVITPVESANTGRKWSTKRVPYDGIIWCPRTPNQSWLARRNGTVYFTGNTSAFGQDCDWLFGIEPPDDEGYSKCRLVTGRRYSRKVIMLEIDYDEGRVEEYAGWAGEDSEADDDRDAWSRSA